MKKKRFDTRYYVMLGLFCAIMLVLQMTGIGLLRLPLINATTMHIPVILGAILLGPTAGGILGAEFGLFSIWTNTTSSSLLSFAFSPVLAAEMCGTGGAVSAVWTALGCRILLGVIAGWLWKWLRKLKMPDVAALPIVAGISTIMHSLLVMGSIGILFSQQFSEAKGIALDTVFGVAMGIVATSGVPEAIAAILIVTAVGKALLSIMGRAHKRRG